MAYNYQQNVVSVEAEKSDQWPVTKDLSFLFNYISLIYLQFYCKKMSPFNSTNLVLKRYLKDLNKGHSFFDCFRLLHALQSLADNIRVQQNETISVPKKSIAMKVMMVNPEDITGLSITAVSTAQPNVNDFVPDSSTDKPRNVIAKVYLPGPLFDKINKSQDDVQRVTVFVFDNEKLFLTNVTTDDSTSSKRGSGKAVGGRIVSVSIKGSKLRNLPDSEQIRTTFSTSTPSAKRHAECVFWDFNAAGMFKLRIAFVFVNYEI